MEDVIVIDFKYIVKLQKWYIDIFYQEDSDYPDYRVIGQKNRHINRVLNLITNDREKQREIYDNIVHHSWDFKDKTYRPICNALRSLGYKIINSGVDDDKRN